MWNDEVWFLRTITRHLSGATKGNHEISVRIAGLWVVIDTFLFYSREVTDSSVVVQRGKYFVTFSLLTAKGFGGTWKDLFQLII